MEIKRLYSFKDDRGDLTPLELFNLPFDAQRIFIVKNCKKGIKRGEHAHYKTQQFLICLKGEIKVITHNGESFDEGLLKEGDCTLIKAYHWDYQVFLTGNDVLLAICSTPFDLNDYILDFNEFLKITKERKND